MDDDLHRSRLTVFFRLGLVLPHLIWLYVWGWVFIVVVSFNWFVMLFSGRSEPDVQSFNGRYVRYATHVYAYLLLIGLYILGKAYRSMRVGQGDARHAGKLGLFGGFVDAVGGGGWGPVVTSSLVGSGNDPRTTIGSVNFAEFFMTLATAASFTFLAVEGTWPVVAGLVIGGLIAAPFAASLCKRINARALMISVGVLITALSALTLYLSL